MNEQIIDGKFLRENPKCIFVFGDNTKRYGRGGAARLRDYPNTWGFITKINPDFKDESFYTLDTYGSIFESEIKKLENLIISNPNNTYLISKIGSGLANKYKIFENIILPGLKKLKNKGYKNVRFLWDL